MILLLSLGRLRRVDPSRLLQIRIWPNSGKLNWSVYELASNIYPPLMRSNGPGFETDLNDVPRLKAVNECLYAKGYN